MGFRAGIYCKALLQNCGKKEVPVLGQHQSALAPAPEGYYVEQGKSFRQQLSFWGQMRGILKWGEKPGRGSFRSYPPCLKSKIAGTDMRSFIAGLELPCRKETKVPFL